MVIRCKIDQQGRIVIPKELREKLGFEGEIEIVVINDGLLLRCSQKKEWNNFFQNKLKANWKKALTVSLDGFNSDELLF